LRCGRVKPVSLATVFVSTNQLKYVGEACNSWEGIFYMSQIPAAKMPDSYIPHVIICDRLEVSTETSVQVECRKMMAFERCNAFHVREAKPTWIYFPNSVQLNSAASL
jgi:hypothetical protein